MKNIVKFISNFFKSRMDTESSVRANEKYPFLDDIPVYKTIGRLDINDLLGKKVTNISQDFSFNKIGGWLDYSASFLTLENNINVEIPFSGASGTSIIEIPKTARTVEKTFLEKFKNRKIVDVHFEYYEDEPDINYNAYIEFDNNYVLTETGMAPHGTGGANLFYYSPEDFRARKIDPDYDIRSIKTKKD